MMDHKERRAIDKCFDSLLRDLDPTTSFLHSLYAENVLTEEQVDRISKSSSRETQVAMLVKYLPHRGPNAFSIFQDKLSKDYPWIAQKLTDELKRLQSGQESINKRLINAVKLELLPLVHSSTSTVDICDEKSHPAVIIQNLSDLIKNLELKCHRALGHKAIGKEKIPIPQLIEDKIKTEQRRVANDDIDDLSKEIKDLKRQLREAIKLKGENEKLKNIVQKQKEKLKDYNKMTRDCKKYKQDMDKYKKETEMLRYEVSILRDQLRGNITEMFT